MKGNYVVEVQLLMNSQSSPRFIVSYSGSPYAGQRVSVTHDVNLAKRYGKSAANCIAQRTGGVATPIKIYSAFEGK